MGSPFRLFSEPRISDHALLRFFERVLGVDVEQLRTRLLTPAIVEAIKAGATSIVADGMTFVIDDCVIVTTLGPGQCPNARKRTHARIVSIDDDELKKLIDEYRRAMGEAAPAPAEN